MIKGKKEKNIKKDDDFMECLRKLNFTKQEWNSILENIEMHKKIKIENMIIKLSKNTFKELKDANMYANLSKEAKELGQNSAMADLKNIANQEIQHYEINKKILESLVSDDDKKHYFYKMQMEELNEMYNEIKNHINEI